MAHPETGGEGGLELQPRRIEVHSYPKARLIKFAYFVPYGGVVVPTAKWAVHMGWVMLGSWIAPRDEAVWCGSRTGS